MHVLITGGAGFIGSHLSDSLIERGDRVCVLDDLSTGSMSNIGHLVGRPGFSHHIGSAMDAPLVGELVDRADWVVHLAAAVGVKMIVERPVHTITTNIGATETVLEAASRHCRPVLIASTSEVYGKSTRARFTEQDDLGLGATVRSRWAYACSKALDEWMAFAYMRERGVPATVVRFFNTVGPRQTGRYGMVVPTFTRQALANEPITVYGDGTQRRCFGHVKDTVESVIRLMDAGGHAGEVFNIGNDEEISMLQLAERIRYAAGSVSEITLIPYEEAYAEGFEDIPRRVPDLTKLEAAIGFRPATPLSVIIDDVLADQRVHVPVC